MTDAREVAADIGLEYVNDLHEQRLQSSAVVASAESAVWRGCPRRDLNAAILSTA
jgi:hypothetical protein